MPPRGGSVDVGQSPRFSQYVMEEPFSILPLSKLCDSVWDGGLELFDEPEPCENNPGSKVAKADAVQIGG